MFDTKDELLAQIRLGEDNRLELKAVAFRGDRVSGPIRMGCPTRLLLSLTVPVGCLFLVSTSIKESLMG